MVGIISRLRLVFLFHIKIASNVISDENGTFIKRGTKIGAVGMGQMVGGMRKGADLGFVLDGDLFGHITKEQGRTRLIQDDEIKIIQANIAIIKTITNPLPRKQFGSDAMALIVKGSPEGMLDAIQALLSDGHHQLSILQETGASIVTEIDS